MRLSSPSDPFPQLTPKRCRKVLKRLGAEIWRGNETPIVQGATVGSLPTSIETALALPYQDVAVGEVFGGPGGSWNQRWFRCHIPAATAETCGKRYLFWKCQGEGTAYWNGSPWAGLDVAHLSCPLPDEEGWLHIDQGSYQTATWPGRPALQPEHGCRFDGATIRVRAEAAWGAYWDLEALLQQLDQLLVEADLAPSATTIGHLPPLQHAPPLLRFLIHRLGLLCDHYDRGDWPEFVAELKAIYEACPAGPHEGIASLVGHAHLDMVWLWPEEIGVRKGIHTFATAQRLLERYPEWTFNQSSPYLYLQLKKREPALFQSVARHVLEGRIEATGGFYIESDLHLPSGEALARSLLYGQRMFTALRGQPSRLAWLPDCFGFPGFIPQLLKLSGLPYFFTSKLRWNSLNRFPHTSFRWLGDDGTEILAHQCPAGYGGIVAVRSLQRAVRENAQGGIFPEVLLGQGLSDGGGGATEEMLERARRCRSLSGLPPARWTTGEAFFDRLSAHRSSLPAYQGELYLETHRGTFTSQSRFKLLYRTCERALVTREALHALLGLPALDASDWERVLFAQDHDALPGPAIHAVYAELQPQLQQVIEEQREATQALLGPSTGLAYSHVFNPHPVAWRGVLRDPKTGGARFIDAPAFSLSPLSPAPALPTAAWVLTPERLSNGRADLVLNPQGEPVRLTIDGRDTLLKHACLLLHPDYPADFDAWDIDHQTLALGRPSPRLGPPRLTHIHDAQGRIVRAEWQADLQVSETSKGTLCYALDIDSAFVRVELAIDWKEPNHLLKYSLQTGYHGQHLRCGSGFGSALRSKRPGRPAEDAQWEVPAQRWAALTHDDGSGGLAIITEAKYGFSPQGGTLGLSLLRSPTYPDATADQGHHTLHFALGSFSPVSHERQLNPAMAAELLFAPPLPCSASHPTRSALRAFHLGDLGSLAPSAIKPAEDGDGFILRLHETVGRPGTITITSPLPCSQITLVDILEAPLDGAATHPVPDAHGGFAIDYRPYQILSLRIRPKG
jgi:alpha-mannosidase